MAGPAPSIRKATTCTHPPTFSSKPSRNARHKSACGSDWPTLTAPSFFPAHATALRSILHQLQAIPSATSARPAGAPAPHPIARVPIGEQTLIKQYLDIGVQTLLVPMVDTAEQAQA